MASQEIPNKMADVQQVNIFEALQKIVSNSANDEANPEVQEKLQNIMHKFSLMTDEEKEVFQRQVQDALRGKLMNAAGNVGPEIGVRAWMQLAAFGFAGVVVLCLFLFFGYKLYKSIMEKELKKEEKKKLKQMKKKK